jgi:signal transduction histidine kinase
MDRVTSTHPLARAWRWLDAHDWVWDPKLRGCVGSVFEGYARKKTALVLAVAVVLGAVAFVFQDFRGRLVTAAIVAAPLLWAVTFAALGRGRREKSPREVWGVAAVAAGVILLAALAANFVFIYVLHWEQTPGFNDGIGGATLGLLIATLVQANRYAIDQRRLALIAATQEGARAEREASARTLAEARLSMLHAQIEPHFIFNALAHLHTLIGEDPAAAQAMTDALTRYLRQAIPDQRRPGSTLRRELDLARAYLEVMKIRMGERLDYTVDAEEPVLDVPFPHLVLATLVENAIKHGLERKPGGGRIAIRASNDENRLVVTVHDDGLGFAPRDESGTGVGLANTRDRLTALYGDEADLDVEPNVPAGCAVTLRIPLKEHRGHGADR